jgi:predicted ester cyclase
MSLEENKNLVRRLYAEVVNPGNAELLKELVAPDFVGHSPDVGAGIGGTSTGIEPLARELAAIRAMLADFQVTIEQLVAEDDRVAVRGVTRGRHTGEVHGIPPTGRDVTITWAAIYRIAAGKIVERWLNADDLSSFQQLGIIPPMPQPAA